MNRQLHSFCNAVLSDCDLHAGDDSYNLNSSKHFQHAQEIAKSEGWSWAIQILDSRVNAYNSQFSKAFEILEQCKKDTPKELHNLIHFFQAGCFQYMQQYDDAKRVYKSILGRTDCINIGYIYSNLGNIYAYLGRYKQSVESYKLALEHSSGIKYSRFMILLNLGVVHAQNNHPILSLEAFQSALKDQMMPDRKRHAVNGHIALLYFTLGYTKKATTIVSAIPTEALEELPSPVTTLRYFLNSDQDTSVLSEVDRIRLYQRDTTLIGETAWSRLKTSLLYSDDNTKYEARILSRIEAEESTQYEKYIARPDSDQSNVLSVLRGWSSSITLLEGTANSWKGGGYFLKWMNTGIVIDPGFDFMRNFHDHDAKYHAREITAVLVSHNHSDHIYDLKKIDDLFYELYKRPGKKRDHGVEPYTLLWDLDSYKSFKLTAEVPKHRKHPILFDLGAAQPIASHDFSANMHFSIDYFKVQHTEDVPEAVGFILNLHDGLDIVKIGYTGDTEYFPELSNYLQDLDLLIAHISQPTFEELKDPSKFKQKHLGYRGLAKLLSDINPTLTIVDEFWAGIADIRLDLIRGIRNAIGHDRVLPASLFMDLELPSMRVRCTQCDQFIPHNDIRTAPPIEEYGPLQYLCSDCLLG